MAFPLDIPPGAVRVGAEYDARTRGRWWDCNLVRWYEGVLRPVGGWVEALGSTLSGICRGGLAWRDGTYSPWLALGTTTNLYVWNGGTLYDITPAGFTAGVEDGSTAFGYGSGPYGEEDYGTARSTGIALEPTSWSMDNWGEDLVLVASHEEIIYEWVGAPGTAAAAISGAPSARAVMVTPERFLFALGADGNPRLIRWSAQEDNTTWAATATNQAGDHELDTTGAIQAGHEARGQLVILTTADCWVGTYQGPPFVYGFRRAAGDCGIISRRAGVAADDRVFWMAADGFYAYDGTVRPIPCDVRDHVFGDLNTAQATKVHAAHLSAFGEVWWWYPSAGSDEIDRYVIFNYREGHWAFGSLARTAWIPSGGVWPYPLAVAPDGTVYEHENGWTDDGASRGVDVYAESGPVEVAPGDRILQINQIIPSEESQGEVRIKLTTRYTPNGDETEAGPYTISSGYVDTRAQGRQIALRVEQVADDDWRWGTPRLDGALVGRR